MRIRLYLLAFLIAQNAQAIVPVIDAKALIGTIRNIQAIEKFKSLAHGDMEKLRGEFNALNPMNFKTDMLSAHTWSANSWQSALSGGGKEMMASLQKFKQENSDLYQFSSQSSQQPEIKKAVQENSVLTAESTQEYDQLQGYMQAINSLSNQIPSSASAKAALDVNNKLLAQIAYLQVEVLHMQVIANQAAAWRMRHQLKAAATTDRFLGVAEKES
jgi:hypothetical protein